MVTDGVRGVWLLCSTSGTSSLWHLWHADITGEYDSGYLYPRTTKMMTDWRRGLWLLCETSGQSENMWKLWHANAAAENDLRCKYPNDTKIVKEGTETATETEETAQQEDDEGILSLSDSDF